MTALSTRGRAGLRLPIWLTAVLLVIATATPLRAAESIVVRLDEARLMKLPERAATVVIGNPLIADLSVQPGGVAVITAKGYGFTNMVVMDRGGAVLTEKMIEVRVPNDIVVVYRGVTRETYSCTPTCSRRITLGDFPDYFNQTLAETTSRNGAATGAGAAAGPVTPGGAPPSR